jgi:tetratricopeptide (TPR) repeat protein
MLTDVLTQAGQHQDALDMLEPAISRHKRRSPQLAQLLVRKARLSAAVGDRENHLTMLKKAFDTDRKNGEIAAEFAKVATDQQEWDLALRALRAISLMDEPGPVSRVAAILWEAKIEHARGNRAKAELWAKKALREDPQFTEAQEFLDQIAD